MALDHAMIENNIRSTLGVNWTPQDDPAGSSKAQFVFNGDPSSSRLRESAYNIDADDELMSSPPPPPNVWQCSLPLLGRAQIVRDIVGYISSSIIVLYWVYGNYSTYFVILLPHYYDRQCPLTMLILYGIISALCIVSFIRATTLNPGSLTLSAEPQSDWMICGKCCRRRPPMAHHCSRCGQCVRKMDHHCPWINNCVGEDNQYVFMMLLAYAYTLSLMTLILDIMHLYYMPHCVSCNPESFAMRHEKGLLYVAIVMAVLMTTGAAALYMAQHISIVFETPSLEWMRIQHALLTVGPKSIVWPQQKQTVFSAYRTTCGDGLWILWPFPCRRRYIPGIMRPQFRV